MRVYYEVLPDTLGRAMYRINKGIKQFAPEWVQFVSDPLQADLQILDCIGKGSLEHRLVKKHVLLQHCVKTEIAPADWPTIWQEAALVVSYLDLPRDFGTGFNYYRHPCGVDPTIFYSKNMDKIFTFLTTGYVAQTESIREVFDATRETKGIFVHVGGDFKWGEGYNHLENVPDPVMRELYDRSMYVSGLRKMEGFELSILEGILCGARGVSFDEEHYTHWYGDTVEYIHDGDFDFVKNQLVELLNKPYRPVTESDIQYIKDNFAWSVIVPKFWEQVKKL